MDPDSYSPRVGPCAHVRVGSTGDVHDSEGSGGCRPGTRASARERAPSAHVALGFEAPPPAPRAKACVFACIALALAVNTYTLVLTKWVPPSWSPVRAVAGEELDAAVRRDSHYALLVTLLAVPAPLLTMYFMWWGRKLFHHGV